ncbi:Lipase, secreted [Metarhizium rileyi]|uniref:Lipase, secreted n=1 Tax=Metarhizium rileyi (strain RCEF 4871) TaxID=1649241 RepID=A0A166S8H6_METRR|nr:Lipase, secreted [Metarhizium rileyi RCEF 4871]
MISTLAWLLTLCLASFSVTICASPVVRVVLDQRATPPLPSLDSFYHVPGNLTSYAPGAIIRHRPPPNPIAAFRKDPVNLKASHQLLYRTTDSLDEATATVLTVLVPHNADYNKVLSYQVAEDSATINCAPSYAFQFEHDTGPANGTSTTQTELLLVEAALEQGWVVIVPDFLGPQGAFLANALAGHATLDGIRAAINSGSLTGISRNPTVTMWGYSGGSLASMFAAELQPSYAPELVIAGAAVGGAVPNITTAVMMLNGQPSAGLIPAGILGLTHQYPELDAVVRRHVLPQFRDEFYKAGTQCLGANSRDFENRDVVGMFDDRHLVYTNPTAVRIISENGLGQHTPTIPMFVYKSIADEISPVSETDALVQLYCKSGTTIQYLRDQNSNHAKMAIIGAPKALSWLHGRMNGIDHQTACSTRTVFSSILDPDALVFLPKFLLDALLDLLWKPVGPII